MDDEGSYNLSRESVEKEVRLKESTTRIRTAFFLCFVLLSDLRYFNVCARNYVQRSEQVYSLNNYTTFESSCRELKDSLERIIFSDDSSRYVLYTQCIQGCQTSGLVRFFLHTCILRWSIFVQQKENLKMFFLLPCQCFPFR